MPYTRVTDPEKLRRLMGSVLMLTADVELDELLRHFVEEARSLVDARYGALGVLDVAGTGLERFLTVGMAAETEQAIGSRPAGRGILGLLITDPRPLRLTDLSSDPGRFGFPPGHPPMTSFLGVPVRVRGNVYGNLYLTDKVGADRFSDEDEAMVEALALAAGTAIQSQRLHEQERALSLLDDRDRIARDLHDKVIQRIFAVGMSLQGAARLPDPAQVAARIDAAVDELDTTITEIRNAIFGLGDRSAPHDLRQAVLDLVAELVPVLGARPAVEFAGPLDTPVPSGVRQQLLAVLREGLSNVSKHAPGAAVEVRVTVSVGAAGGGVTVRVLDAGPGFDPTTPAAGLGLGNMARRAAEVGGTFSVGAGPEGGTSLLWSAPLPAL